MKIKLLNDRVLVKRKEHNMMTESGLHLTDRHRQREQEGTVFKAGPGRKDKDGNRIPMGVKEGDKVLVSIRAIREIKIDGETYLDMRDKDIFGVIE